MTLSIAWQMLLIRLLVNLHKSFTTSAMLGLMHSVAYLSTSNDARIFYFSNSISSVLTLGSYNMIASLRSNNSISLRSSQLCEFHQNGSPF